MIEDDEIRDMFMEFEGMESDETEEDDFFSDVYSEEEEGLEEEE